MNMSFLLTLFYCAVLGVSWFDVFSFINRDTPLFYVLLFAPSILIYYAFASEYVRAIEQRRRNFREMNVLETDENKPIIYNRITEILDLGFSMSGEKSRDNIYLVVAKPMKVNGRKIERNNGTTVWVWVNIYIDAPIVHFGGRFNDQSIIGELSIQSHMSKKSKSLYSSLCREINKMSEKINGVNLGKEYLVTK